MFLEYFNTTLKEFKVIYPENTSYYTTKNEFHNILIIF